MRLNINATGMNTVPFQVGVFEESDIERIGIVVYLSGASYSPSQLDAILVSLSSKAGFEWLMPTGKLWAIDADKLKDDYGPLKTIPWFKGHLVSSYDTQFGSTRGSMGNLDQSGRGLAIVGHHPLTALTFSFDKEIALDSNCLFYSWMSDRETTATEASSKTVWRKQSSRSARTGPLALPRHSTGTRRVRQDRPTSRPRSSERSQERGRLWLTSL